MASIWSIGPIGGPYSENSIMWQFLHRIGVAKVLWIDPLWMATTSSWWMRQPLIDESSLSLSLLPPLKQGTMVVFGSRLKTAGTSPIVCRVGPIPFCLLYNPLYIEHRDALSHVASMSLLQATHECFCMICYFMWAPVIRPIGKGWLVYYGAM